MQERSAHSWLIPATGSLALIPAVAGASGFALLEQSASRLGTAFAGTAAAADDATTVFFNPAGMTSLREPEAVVSASGIAIGSEFRNDSSVAAFAQRATGAAVIAANAGRTGLARVRGDDDAWGFNVGALFDLSDSTRVGVSYRSSVEYTVSGSIAFAAPAGADPIASSIISAASAPGAPLSSGAARVALELPDSATMSLQHRFTKDFALLADAAWTGWSSVQELRIVRDSGATASVTPERWSDTWRFALGATYAMNERVTLRAGVAIDETPVPDDTRTPRLPDSDRTWVAIGAHWEISPALLMDFGYAHLFSDTVPLDQDADNVAASALLNGRRHSDVDIVSAQLVYRF